MIYDGFTYLHPFESDPSISQDGPREGSFVSTQRGFAQDTQ